MSVSNLADIMQLTRKWHCKMLGPQYNLDGHLMRHVLSGCCWN